MCVLGLMQVNFICEVKIVDFSIVIKLHQLLKVIKPEVYMESMHQ